MNLAIPRKEFEVLMLYCAGAGFEQIGSMLGISPHTARNHIRSAQDRTGVVGKMDLARVLCRNGWTPTLYLLVQALNHTEMKQNTRGNRRATD